MRVAGAIAAAVYLGGLVYIFPAPYDVFDRGIVERRMFAAACTVAWIALQGALALSDGARPGRRLAVSSSIACLPWALGRAWMAAPLWLGAFALLRPFPWPSGSAGSLDSRGAALLLGIATGRKPPGAAGSATSTTASPTSKAALSRPPSRHVMP